MSRPIGPYLLRTRLARALWMIRIANGWSQTDVGRRARMPRTRISDFERGERFPSVYILLRVAKALKVPCSVLFRITEMEGE